MHHPPWGPWRSPIQTKVAVDDGKAFYNYWLNLALVRQQAVAKPYRCFSSMQTMKSAPRKVTTGRHFSAVALITLSITAYSNARAESAMLDLTYSPSQSNVMPTLGVGIYDLKDAGPGFYMNGSLSGNPDTYYGSTCSSCGSLTSTQQGSALFAIGATFPLVTPEMKVPIYKTLHTYLGLGYGSLSGYAQYSKSSYWYDYSSKDE